LAEDIPNKIRNSMGIICDVQLKDQRGKKYIVIKVNPYSVAVSLRGRYYYRSGSTKMELTGVELNEFLLKKAGKTWDDVLEEGAKINDIDKTSLNKFIADSKGKGRLPETKTLSIFQILEKLQLTEGKKIKRAAIILFGRNPNQFYPNVQVKIGRFGKDSTDLKFHEIVEGNLVSVLEEVQVKLNDKFFTRPISFDGLKRIEKDEYPVEALREMLLNALVHRSYMGAPVQMRIYDDRLSIWNEGGLPAGLQLEDLKVEHNSRPRNPKIAKACFMAGYIDTWGRGTLKIINACLDSGFPAPEISEKDGGILVMIRKPAESAKPGVTPSSTIGGAIGSIIGGTMERLTERQKEILNLIIENPEISIRIAAKNLRINNSAAQEHFNVLKKKGIIKREGKTRGRWIILSLQK